MKHGLGNTARAVFVIAAAFFAATPLFAQQVPGLPTDNPVIELKVPAMDGLTAIEKIAPSHAKMRKVHVQALLADGSQPMQQGIAWRIFSAIPGEDGKLPLVASSEGGTTDFQLPPGEYFLNAAFGRAAATKKLRVADGEIATQTLVLDAGGLRLHAVTGEDTPIPESDLRFSVYTNETDANGERALVVADIKPDMIVRLNADTYHVVSEYGRVNAVIQADIQVSAGKITEATLEHRAARVTLKLVSAPGGEAIADTAWSVLTASGDLLSTNVGAYPSMVLAEGNYTAVARNKERIYQKDFEVKAGINADVEVLLEDGAPIED